MASLVLVLLTITAPNVNLSLTRAPHNLVPMAVAVRTRLLASHALVRAITMARVAKLSLTLVYLNLVRMAGRVPSRLRATRAPARKDIMARDVKQSMIVALPLHASTADLAPVLPPASLVLVPAVSTALAVRQYTTAVHLLPV